MSNKKINTEIQNDNDVIEPQKQLQRNEFGLIASQKYVYNQDGYVNWLKLIRSDNFALNREYKDKIEAQVGKPFDSINIAEVEEKYLIILLAGFKELAQIRGYSSVKYDVCSASREYVAVSCSIEWIPNFETNYQTVIFSSLADASLDNTYDFGQNYLMPIAENRAFVRCVRNFLGVNIVGKDEIGPSKNNRHQEVNPTNTNPKPTEPHGVLKQKLDNKGKSFEKFKKDWVKAGNEHAETWQSYTDIPISEVWTILDALKQKETMK